MVFTSVSNWLEPYLLIFLNILVLLRVCLLFLVVIKVTVQESSNKKQLELGRQKIILVKIFDDNNNR